MNEDTYVKWPRSQTILSVAVIATMLISIAFALVVAREWREKDFGNISRAQCSEGMVEILVKQRGSDHEDVYSTTMPCDKWEKKP